MPINPKQMLRDSYKSFANNNQSGFGGVFAPFGVFDAMSGKGRGLGRKKPPGTPANPQKPATPPSQWTFQPNPLDQPPGTGSQPGTVSPGNPGAGGGQNPWAFSPPIQPWMFNPTGGGGWQDPGFSGNFPPNFFANARPPQIGGPGPTFDPSQAATQWPSSGMSDMMYRAPGWNQPPTSQPTGSSGAASWYYPPKY